jgi:hypothetical protein
MTEMIWIAVGLFAVVAMLYGIYGGLTAGADWKNWLVEQALPLYGVMAVALVGLIVIVSTITSGRGF